MQLRCRAARRCDWSLRKAQAAADFVMFSPRSANSGNKSLAYPFILLEGRR
jgi:hypothetical protein